jgi:hypothetical protein
MRATTAWRRVEMDEGPGITVPKWGLDLLIKILLGEKQIFQLAR